MPDQGLLEKYADVTIRVGLGLRTGERLLIRSDLQATDFTRILVRQAYEAGASDVTVLWGDDETGRYRFSHGSAEASSAISSSAHFTAKAIELGDLVLTVMANDPDALAGQDVARIGSFQKANGEFLQPSFTALGSMEHKWCVVAAPTPSWASKVLPDIPADVAVERLWESVFRACRADSPDPVAAWSEHSQMLLDRAAYLTDRSYEAIRYEGPGTDLTMGLPENVIWRGGGVEAPDGTSFVPNLPTEEVFTSPHRLNVNGTVTASKPLSLMGNLVDEFSFDIDEGRVVSAVAGKGQEILDQMLKTDDGSVYLGEAAMVPMSSAVAAEGLVWNNTLYDENDGCHIAIGRAYPICIEGGPELSAEEQIEKGLNHSSVHVDFVVGSAELSIFGIRSDGVEEPIISNGEWGFKV